MVNHDNVGNTSSYVCVGVIVAPQGVRGELKLHSYTQNPEDLTAYGPLYNQSGTKTFNLHVKRVQNDVLIATLEGCTDRNAAEVLRGTKLYIPREALPDIEADEFYYEDLLGLKVVRPDLSVVGTVKAIHNFGAGDVLELALLESDKTEMLPFTREIIPTINLKEGFVVVHLPEVLIAKEGHE